MRNINYLLKKYGTKQPGEVWDREHEVEYIQDYREKQRIFMLDGIVNSLHGNFKISKQQRQRLIYLIRDLDFYTGPYNDKQRIVMLIVYVKLETQENRQYDNYQKLLQEYHISTNLFIRFLVTLNQYHIQRIPLPYHYLEDWRK